MHIISEHFEETRNAKVYRNDKGQFGVDTYDSMDDFNGYRAFPTIDLAENYAEDFVQKKRVLL